MKNFYQWLKWAIISLSLLIPITGFILYFSHFGKGLSSESSEWANFATFNGYFISISTVLILAYLSLITYQATQDFNKLQIRPLLFLIVDYPEQIKNVFKDTWYVVNAAKYPAINPLVRYTENRLSNKYSKWVSCSSLTENKRLELFWIQGADKIEICYTDLTSEKYYKLEYEDLNGKTCEIKPEDYNRNLKEAVDNRQNNIIHLRDKLEKFVAEQKTSGADPKTKYFSSFIHPLLFKED